MNRRQNENSTTDEMMAVTETGSRLLTELMVQSNMPRNQVASMSGLTNTYLRDMELGNVSNVSRQRVIRLSLALSLELDQIDRLLHAFDRTGLTTRDIPLFLKASREMTVSGALHPVRSLISYDLYINAARRIPGDQFHSLQVIGGTLQARGHSAFLARRSGNHHPILSELKEAIEHEKYRTLVRLLENSKVENFACGHCLEDYIYYCDDPEERSFRLEHLRSLIRFLQEQRNFHFYLTNVCPPFQFTLKFPDDAETQTEKVWFMGKLIRSCPSHPRSKLIAFATDNPQLVATFKAEMQVVRGAAVKDLLSKEKMVAHLENMMTEAQST
jgi:transcriptional regulator with XRE-family HTH domain